MMQVCFDESSYYLVVTTNFFIEPFDESYKMQRSAATNENKLIEQEIWGIFQNRELHNKNSERVPRNRSIDLDFHIEIG